jgi:hypothetical protein
VFHFYLIRPHSDNDRGARRRLYGFLSGAPEERLSQRSVPMGVNDDGWRVFRCQLDQCFRDSLYISYGQCFASVARFSGRRHPFLANFTCTLS